MTTDGAHNHPNARTYWITALVLAVLTAIEIGISYIEGIDNVRPIMLLAFGVAKFIIVIAVFMHLKFDSKSYRRLFLIGIFGAMAVFAVVLAAMHAFV